MFTVWSLLWTAPHVTSSCTGAKSDKVWLFLLSKLRPLSRLVMTSKHAPCPPCLPCPNWSFKHPKPPRTPGINIINYHQWSKMMILMILSSECHRNHSFTLVNLVNLWESLRTQRSLIGTRLSSRQCPCCRAVRFEPSAASKWAKRTPEITLKDLKDLRKHKPKKIIPLPFWDEELCHFGKLTYLTSGEKEVQNVAFPFFHSVTISILDRVIDMGPVIVYFSHKMRCHYDHKISIPRMDTPSLINIQEPIRSNRFNKINKHQ
jgi:hypothetical protein